MCHLLRGSGIYLIAHQGRDGPANLVIAVLVPGGAQHDEDEPCGDGDLRDVPQVLPSGQTHEGNDGVREELHLPHQDVGGFRPRGESLHEVTIRLWGGE